MIPIRFLYRAAKYRWRKDHHELALISALLRPGATAVDIGAHKGGYLFWLQRWVGPEGRVVAFEPQRQLSGYLQRVADRANWAHVEIEPLAVSSVPGKVAAIELPEGVDAASSSPGAKVKVLGGSDRSASPAEVLTTTLDDYFPGPRLPGLIKCDCEGHELEVFLGGRRLLESGRPALLFECEARHRVGGDIESVFRYLEELGYRGWRIDRNRLTPIRPLGEPPGPVSGTEGNNYLFLGVDRAPPEV